MLRSELVEREKSARRITSTLKRAKRFGGSVELDDREDILVTRLAASLGRAQVIASAYRPRLAWLNGVDYVVLLTLTSIQDFADFASQKHGREGLLQKVDLCLQDAVANDRVIGEAAGREDFHFRVQSQQALRQLTPAEVGHDDVGNEQMNRPLVFLGDARGAASSIVRLQDFITPAL